MSISDHPPKTVQGALIQLFPEQGLVGIGNMIPIIVQFDLNPETLTREYTPWKAETERGAPVPGAGVQPFTVPEKFSQFKIELDPIAAKASLIPTNMLTVEARLSALRKMISPSKGLVEDLLISVKDLVGQGDEHYDPPEIAPIFLWLGVRIILPVQIESLTITEHQHDVLYFPTRATVTMDLTVMTPDRFRCSDSIFADIAIAAYNYTKAQQDLTAIASTLDISPLWRLVAPA